MREKSLKRKHINPLKKNRKKKKTGEGTDQNNTGPKNIN